MACGGGVLTSSPDWSVLCFPKAVEIFAFWFMLAKGHINYACVGLLS